MKPESSFQELMDRLRQGDPDAGQQVFRQFSTRLIALARGRLDGVLRRKLDPEDVMQSVLRSFFRRHQQDEFELENWDSLWSLLALITLRKCGYQVRHFTAERRDVRREVTPPAEADSAGGWEAIAREPTPEEAAMLAETVEQLFRGL